MLSLHFTILCSQLQTVQKTETGSFPLEETTAAVFLSLSLSLSLSLCVYVCVFPCQGKFR